MNLTYKYGFLFKDGYLYLADFVMALLVALFLIALTTWMMYPYIKSGCRNVDNKLMKITIPDNRKLFLVINLCFAVLEILNSGTLDSKIDFSIPSSISKLLLVLGLLLFIYLNDGKPRMLIVFIMLVRFFVLYPYYLIRVDQEIFYYSILELIYIDVAFFIYQIYVIVSQRSSKLTASLIYQTVIASATIGTSLIILSHIVETTPRIIVFPTVFFISLLYVFLSIRFFSIRAKGNIKEIEMKNE